MCMTMRAKTTIGLLLLVLLMAACGGDDSATVESVTGDETASGETADDETTLSRSSSSGFSDDEAASDTADGEGVADGFDPIFGQILNTREILPLQGTAWLIDAIDSEPHDGAISFAWREGEGVVAWFRDECTTGGFTTSIAVREGWLIINDDPPPNCSSPMSAIFSDGAVVEFNLVSEDELTISSPAGEFSATHWESVSVHDEPLVIEFE